MFEYRNRRALHGVSFAVPQGSVTAMVGPNGAGKTTLLRCLAALEEPLSGRITVDGLDIQDSPRLAHRKLGFLQDFFGVYETLSVRQNLLYAAATMGVPKAHVAEAAEKAIRSVGLDAYKDRRGTELSRGQRQRLAIARTIVHGPKLLLLDEPASGLDPDARRDLSSLIRSLQAAGTTLIVSSHILTELQDYSTHMLAVKDGQVRPLVPVGGADLASGRRLALIVHGPVEPAASALAALPGVSQVAITGQHVTFTLAGSDEEQAALLRHLVLGGIQVVGLATATENLEQLYFGKTS